MLYLLTKVLLYIFFTIAWYYGFVFISLGRKIVLWCVLGLLFLSKFIEHITGGKSEQEIPQENNQIAVASKTKQKSVAKQSKGKVRQRTRKANDEPTFNTNLLTPIEDIIEETLSEEKSETQSSSSQSSQNIDIKQSSGQVVKSKKKKRPVKKEKLQDKFDLEEDLGYSFFKPKTRQSREEHKQVSETHVKSNVGGGEKPIINEVGFSNKVKNKEEKSKSLLEKRNSEEALSAIIAKSFVQNSDLSKPSIIEHYINLDLPKYNTTQVLKEHSQSSERLNKIDTNSTKTILKESKKVASHISYASVVSQSVLENINLQELPQKNGIEVNILEYNSTEDSSFKEKLSETNYPEPKAYLNQENHTNNKLLKNKNDYITSEYDDLEESIEIVERPTEKQEFSISHKENSLLNSITESVNHIEEDIEISVVSHNKNLNSSSNHKVEVVTEELNDQDINEQLVNKQDLKTVQDRNEQDNGEDNIKFFKVSFQKDQQIFPEHSQTSIDYNYSKVSQTEISYQTDIVNKNCHLDTEKLAVSCIPKNNLLDAKESNPKFYNCYSDSSDNFVWVKKNITDHLREEHLPPTNSNHISECTKDLIKTESQAEVSTENKLQIKTNLENQVEIESQSYDENLPDTVLLEKDPITEDNQNTSVDSLSVKDSINSDRIDPTYKTNQTQNQNFTVSESFIGETLDLDPPLTLPDQNQIKEPFVEHQIFSTDIFYKSVNIQEPFLSSVIVSQSSDSQKVSIESHPSGVITKSSYSSRKPLFSNMSQIRVLTLNDKEHQEATICRIEKDFILQFRLGPSLLGRKIKLYCNYPKEANGVLNEFDRGTYQLLSWSQDEGCKNADDTAVFAPIVAKKSGSFHYYFTYENEDSEDRLGSGYFLVDPVLKYGNNKNLPLDCIQCQTVLSKHLGPFSTWENKLRVAKESGYNMIHFTPIQELGASKSSYSLSEQLKLNPMFNEENGKKPTVEDIEKLTSTMRNEWKVLSICDIVLNHTANESEWIKEHPEATYNCVNCPYMRPAYLLDAAFYQFSLDVKKGYYEDRGIPPEVSSEEHLNAIRYHFKTSVLESLKMYELFTINVNNYLEQFLALARKTPPLNDNERQLSAEIKIIQDPEFRRLQSKIDLDLTLNIFNTYRLDCFDEESRVKRCAEDLKKLLDSLNEKIVEEVNDDLNVAIENVIAGIRYFRVQADGPKLKEITTNNPLVHRYFTDYDEPKSLKDCEEIMYTDNGRFIMAHNGWVMNSDPLKNFAAAGTKIYLRRELIAWGDSVKLRYGDSPEDSPFLWDYMRKYVEQTSKIFDGVRLDNCHSTPIPVAEYLLDAARKVRPDLYVVAELFTNSDLTDNIFVNRLGITSLIREAMSAWDSHEEGRLVYRYGGVPVGSFYQPNVRPLVPMVAHALFLDLTHDNPSPVEKRSVFDLLPSTALVNMACCASGSNRGYDELVPHHIHVVDETRQYMEWTEDETTAVDNVRFVNDKFGIIAAKRALNDLHFKLGQEKFNQVYVDQIDSDIVAVTRHNPDTHISYVLVAFTAFSHPDIQSDKYQRGIKPLRIEGVLDEIVLEASLSHVDAKSSGSRFKKSESFTKDSTWINGLSEYHVSVKQHIQVGQSDVFEEVNSGSKNVIQLNFNDFKPGSIAVIRVVQPEDIKDSILKIRDLIDNFSINKDTELKQIVNRMTLADLNRALYRCDQEERDEGNGFDVYNIPNFGPVVYSGLQGFMSLLANIRPSNDLGHPFCANLRDGNWVIEYIWKRLKVDEGTKELGQWIEENTKHLHNIPRYLHPCYFDVVVTGLYVTLLEQSYSLMSDFVKHGSTFVRSLSLGSLQFGGYVRSADLPVLSPNLAPPKPPTRKNKNGEIVQACVTLSAGLPHFSVGYTRNWGRDTFIALRGMFILTGRFEEARQHILGYAACMRHGLIPNLLDGGRNSRFNCRDAIWWWLYCLKSYCEEAPNGLAILSDKVSRIFPTDDSAPQPPGAYDQPLYDVIQEGLKVHFQGLKFRERNAGRQIDEQMTDAGFNNQIGIHPETGFVFGGNQWNCGTWMDKMGSSEKAGNKGKPATPRDGSAVELIGLSKAAVSWLWKLNDEGIYPYDGVERTHKNGAIIKWTFKEWSDKIQANFENKFWIGTKPSSDESRPDLINKKNIYKDTFGASQAWTDFQLRPNVPVAMVAAPELFDPQHAWAALEQTEKYLLGPLGMKTLDPEDWNYRGDYDNSNDSDDFHTSHGFNYHQGPEWVWPVGFFLRAKLIFAAQNGMLKETLSSTKVILSRHFTALQTSPWRGLPELTNSNGSYCKDSSPTQAWSMSCILEVLHDLQQIESKQIIVN